MDLSNRVTQLEDEIKVLKNELLAVLLDVKEELLARENPFQQQSLQAPQVFSFSQSAPQPSEPPQPKPAPEKCEETTAAREEARADTTPADEDADEDEEPSSVAPVSVPRKARVEPPPGKTVSTPLENDADSVWVDELIKSWRPVEPAETRMSGEHASNGRGAATETIGANISLATLSGLAGWVAESASQLGGERIHTILDISETMGDIPTELKMTLEKLIPQGGPEVDSGQIPAQTYLSALKRLASLLGKENTNDFVVMHMVSHGLNSRRTSGQ